MAVYILLYADNVPGEYGSKTASHLSSLLRLTLGPPYSKLDIRFGLGIS
jgi:hypothetical protein